MGTLVVRRGVERGPASGGGSTRPAWRSMTRRMGSVGVEPMMDVRGEDYWRKGLVGGRLVFLALAIYQEYEYELSDLSSAPRSKACLMC